MDIPFTHSEKLLEASPPNPQQRGKPPYAIPRNDLAVTGKGKKGKEQRVQNQRYALILVLGNTEPGAVAPIRRAAPAAVGRTQVVRIEVPGTAAENTQSTRIIGIPTIGYPFPYVSMDIVKTKWVG